MTPILPFVVIGIAVIGFLTFINTDFALIVLIFAMLLSPEFSAGAVAGGRSVAIRAEDVLIIVIFFTWLAKKVMNNETGLLRRNRLNAPIAGYTIAVILATLWGIINRQVVPAKGAFYVLKYVEYFMLFFMVTNSISSEKQIRRFVFFMAVTAVITSLYGLTTIADVGRATAPFEDLRQGGEPNTLGGYLVLMSGLALGVWAYSGNVLLSVVLLAFIALCGYTLLETLSRGSYLAFIAMFLSATLLTTRKKMVLIGVIVFALVSGWVFLPSRVTSRIQETFVPHRTYEPLQGLKIRLDESASARVETWKTVFERWKRSPVLGHGASGAGFIDSQYPLVLGETGLVGLFFFLILMLSLMKEGMYAFKSLPDGYYRGIALGFLAGFVGLLVHSFSAATFIIIRIMEPFWFLTAIVIALPGLYSAQDDNLSPPEPYGTEPVEQDTT